jgi:hypothetical protein
MLQWIRGAYARVVAWFRPAPPPEPEKTSPEPGVVLAPAPDVERATRTELERAVEGESTTSSERPERRGEKHDFSHHYLRQDLSEKLGYVLERFENLSPRRAESTLDDMAMLEDLWGGDFLLLDRAIGDRMIGGSKWDIIDGIPTSETADAVWPVDQAFVYAREGHIELMRLTTVSLKELRGMPMKMVTSKMLRATGGYFFDDGSWRCYHNIFGLVGEDWRMMTTPRRYDLSNLHIPDMKKWNKRIKDRLPSVFRYEFDWHVAFGSIDGGPRVVTPINPQQALKLFRNRQAMAGETRRAALKHWVEEHWREGEEGIAYICHHLRGHTKFKWSDLSCELFVSASDLRKNDFFKKQASEWRAKRKHNRVRVHLKQRADNRSTRPSILTATNDGLESSK